MYLYILLGSQFINDKLGLMVCQKDSKEEQRVFAGFSASENRN